MARGDRCDASRCCLVGRGLRCRAQLDDEALDSLSRRCGGRRGEGVCLGKHHEQHCAGEAQRRS